MVNFPNKKKIIKIEGHKNTKAHINIHSNAGMGLEHIIDITNKYYLTEDIAVIYKKPTPIRIAHVEFPSRANAKITEAYYRVSSTTDYNGIYKGKYIDFDAKETSTSNLPLSNVHSHQVRHLRRVVAQGGIAFLLVYFRKYEEYFYLPIERFFPFWDQRMSGGKKSISYSDFKEIAYSVKLGFLPRLPYLNVVDEHFL